MIYIIITSYNEPNSTRIAINKFLDQNIKEDYKIIVADPFPEVEEMIVNEFPSVEYFEDPDKGKSYTLNIILGKILNKEGDVIVMTDVAEDTVIPYLFFKKGFKIAYAENAKVYVKHPDNFKDWVKQKKRVASAHLKLKKYYPDFPKVKSFFNEVFEGISFKVWKYPKNLKEFYWTLSLYPVRLYMWMSLFYDNKFRKKEYKDGWREDLAVESTRPMD